MRVPPRSNARPPHPTLTRRDVIGIAGAAVILGRGRSAAADDPRQPDYTLEIAPTTLELSPRHRVRTFAYNGQAPGPLLRLREGREVTIQVTNRSDTPEVVHWHGLFLPAAVDGSMEEGTPAVAPSATVRYTFTPRPAGFRWYHTHTMAMDDLSRAQYGGQHGFLLVEPSSSPAPYDQEFFLALHDWDGHLFASDDGAMNPTYNVSTINGKVSGAGEPLRVRAGQRVLLHILNSSATETHWVSLAGHGLRVVALDGNPVASSQVVPMLRLAPAERVCAIVEMNNPGVWILGEVRKHVQAAGMGIVVEYANQTGAPRWQQPAQLLWSYEQFAAAAPPLAAPAEPPPTQATTVPLVFESKFRGHGAMESWTINGKSYPDVTSTPLERGGRYRLQLINTSQDDHPLHLHRHSFELRSHQTPLKDGNTWTAPAQALRGITKDVVLVGARSVTEVDFTANNPGPTLFHCHQQNHMDLGFMMLFNYG
jgi:FtsP/CotA-like multicopper oxidase with cupredoxin domain